MSIKMDLIGIAQDIYEEFGEQPDIKSYKKGKEWFVSIADNDLYESKKYQDFIEYQIAWLIDTYPKLEFYFTSHTKTKVKKSKKRGK